MKEKRGNGSSGLTLFELMTTLALMAALFAVLWMVYQTGFGIFHSQMIRIGAKGEASRCLIRMEEELRHATALTAAQQTSVSFSADTDDNGVSETIQYAWSGTAGTALNRTSGTSTTPLVNFVEDLAFSYYDANNSLLSFPVTVSQVKALGIDFTAKDEDETFQLRSRVRLRNL